MNEVKNHTPDVMKNSWCQILVAAFIEEINANAGGHLLTEKVNARHFLF